MRTFSENALSADDVKTIVAAETGALRKKVKLAYLMSFMSLLTATVLLAENILTGV
jgi:hypothetical protein